MRLMIIGQLEGYISQAGKIALQRGAKVIHCEDTEQALGALMNGKGADLVMVDVKQKIGDFIERLKTERIHLPVVACGVGTDARSAVKAIQEGAKEYVPLPPDAELIAAIIEAVTDDNSKMIANDPSMKSVVTLADKIAPSEATVLITGESGTGKEVMSRHIHAKSKRKNGPFIAVNCAAIPENLLESELFGHEKGAFTGASARRIGKFEEASGGTLLLDEVSEMHVQLQAKLLRAIQEKEITRVGSNDAVKVDVLGGPFAGCYEGVASLGVRPMFGVNAPNFEVHLFDFSGDLYGQHLSVALVEYLRPEARFDGLQALIDQMDEDSRQARAILARI